MLSNNELRALLRAQRFAARLLAFAAVLVPSIFVPSGAQAQSSMMGDTTLGRKHQFMIGVAQQDADADFFASTDRGPGASISLRDLAIDNTDETFFGEYRYHFKPRWALAIGAYGFSATGGRTLERQLSFDGVDFDIGATTRATLDVDAYIFDVLYKAYESQKLSLWVGGGVHALDLGANIRGEVAVNADETEFEAANESLLAPVPNVRAVATWAFNRQFALSLKTGWLSANVDDYSGDFTYAHLRAIYAFNQTFSLALGYQFTEVDITQDRERGGLGFDVALEGPTLTLGFGF